MRRTSILQVGGTLLLRHLKYDIRGMNYCFYSIPQFDNLYHRLMNQILRHVFCLTRPFQFGLMITSWQLPFCMMGIDCLSVSNPRAYIDFSLLLITDLFGISRMERRISSQCFDDDICSTQSSSQFKLLKLTICNHPRVATINSSCVATRTWNLFWACLPFLY